MDHKEVDDSQKLMDCEEDHTTTKSFVLIGKDAEKLIQMNAVELSSKVSKFLATLNLMLMSIIFIKLTNFNFFHLINIMQNQEKQSTSKNSKLAWA